MSRYRHLKGLAHDLATCFATSCAHFAFLAIGQGLPTVTVDLVTGRLTPASWASPRNLNLLESCQRLLRAGLARMEPGTVTAATLGAHFQGTGLPHQPAQARAWVWVTLQDDRQRTWTLCLSQEVRVSP